MKIKKLEKGNKKVMMSAGTAMIAAQIPKASVLKVGREGYTFILQSSQNFMVFTSCDKIKSSRNNSIHSIFLQYYVKSAFKYMSCARARINVKRVNR